MASAREAMGVHGLQPIRLRMRERKGLGQSRQAKAKAAGKAVVKIAVAVLLPRKAQVRVSQRRGAPLLQVKLTGHLASTI